MKEKSKREELLEMLDNMIDNIEKLPPGAMLTPVTHYDLASSLILLAALFRSERTESS